ncbi:MAG: helix-turn-helix transcriptional regulator [Butyrivibrio sp.]|nr:helix-turn-helix transcriptional regulator [Butyrivibrio sp.]
MEVGHIIARLRTEKKLSQRDLAKEINVSAGVIGLWETNKRLPSYEFIIALADYFAISTDVFFEKDRKLKPEEYKKMEFPLQTQKMITIFEQFTDQNKDILIGKAQEYLKNQQKEQVASRDITHEKNSLKENMKQA